MYLLVLLQVVNRKRPNTSLESSSVTCSCAGFGIGSHSLGDEQMRQIIPIYFTPLQLYPKCVRRNQNIKKQRTGKGQAASKLCLLVIFFHIKTLICFLYFHTLYVNVYTLVNTLFTSLKCTFIVDRQDY